MGRPRSRRVRRRREGAEPFAGEGSVAAAEEVAVAGEGSVAEGRARMGTGTVEVEVEVERPRDESAARSVAAKGEVAAPSQRARREVRWRGDRVRGRASHA